MAKKITGIMESGVMKSVGKELELWYLLQFERKVVIQLQSTGASSAFL